MNEIYLLLNRLSSTDERLEVCRRLRRFTDLPREAVFALELASRDSDLRVSRAARLTLITHRLKINKILPVLGWAALISVGLMAAWFFYKDITITESLICQRESPGSAVSCVEQPYYFYLIPLSAREIHDVRGVDIQVITDSDDLELYNLKLITGGGIVELSSGYSYHYPYKRAMADQITNFVTSETETTLALHDSGYLTGWTVFFLCGPELAIVLVFLLLQGLKRLRERKKLANNPSQSINSGLGTKSETDFGGGYE